MFRSVLVRAAVVACLCLVAIPATASALPGAHVSTKKMLKPVSYAGVQHLHFEYGPIDILPGQNNIEAHLNRIKPKVPGYITRFKPNLVYSGTKKVPRVDVIHLHHGVWLINSYPTFAAGEEKTTFMMPRGYGYHSDPKDTWIMNYMIHNLTPQPTRVSITYDIDFVPDTTAAAKSLTRAYPLWMDVSGLRAYPVFDALKGEGGRDRKFTFPDEARPSQQDDIGFAHEYTAQKDMTLLNTAGHLHPGGLYTDLKVTRGSRTRELFRSEAKYFEPAGAVSWDVAMTTTEPGWRVALHAGDTLSVSSTYDVSRASWYESMGIMPLFYADGIRPGAKDPFSQRIDWHGRLTHGHLKENDHHGGELLGLPDARDLLSGAAGGDVAIGNFLYRRGGLSLTGRRGRPPVVRAGGRLRFRNFDAVASDGPDESIYHTITACRAPCNRTAGIAYPLANARPGANFDSGELGFGPGFATPAAQRNTWRTPRRLRPGTYTYFCRIHPFMRGAFRVVKPKKSS